MRRRSSPTLVDLLRSTLVRLERKSKMNPEDRAVQNLERSIVRTIAEVQLQKSQKAEEPKTDVDEEAA